MTRLVRTKELDKFAAVDDDGRQIAVGTLEVDLIPGAHRHGTVSFVTEEPTDGGRHPLEEAAGFGGAI